MIIQFSSNLIRAVAILLIVICCNLHAQSSIKMAGIDNTAAPTIDGKLGDSEWKDARVFTDFHMMIPKSDSKDYDSTIVYIKQSIDAIYIAIKYWPRGKIIRQSLTRDRSTEEENEFFILLDLENNNQNGYIFAISFLDNQRDAIVYNQRNQSYQWDWQWENKSTIFKEASGGQAGYAEMEVKIPVDRLQNKNEKQIGIDVQMFSYKPDGNYFYYSIAPNSELLNLKSLYKLDLTTPFDEKLNLQFDLTPFIVTNKFNNFNTLLTYGGEFAVSLDKHMLKSTYNTDESTLEADPFRFSFYGRPIFLTEKRPFFSKDLDIFNTPINLFYTRAIDNINYGFNYTYRSDMVKIGAVYVQEDTALYSPGSKRKFAALRSKFDFKDFNVGGLVVHSRDTLGDFKETVVSLDGKINLPSNFRFIPQFARSFNTDGTAANMYNAVLYLESNSNSGPFMDAYYTRYDSNFNCVTLFNNYGNNYDETGFSGGYQFIRNTKYFNNISVSAGYNRSRVLTDNFNFQNGVFANLFYKATGWLSFFHSINYDRPNQFDENGSPMLDESGKMLVRDNLLTEQNVKLVFGNNSVSAGFYGGRYFNETLLNPYTSVDLSFFGKLRVGANLSYIWQGDVKQTIYNVQFNYKIMDKLFLKSYFQKDTYGHRALLNTLVQYEFFAGSSIYLVLNLEGERLQYSRRYFKVNYEFRF